MSHNLIFGAIVPLDLEILAGIASILGLIAGAALWINTVQDKLNERFYKIELRHSRLRGALGVSFNSIENRLGAVENKVNELINFMKNRGFDERQTSLRNENLGTKLWNSSGLDEDTKIPED